MRLRAAQAVNAQADATTRIGDQILLSLSGGVLRRTWVLLVGLLLLAGVAEAATVNLNTATFSWTAPVVDATHGAPASYTMKCGPTTGTYPTTFSVSAFPLPPPTSTLVKNVVGAGTWFCVVTAVNAGGESPPSGEVTFQGAYPPSPPATLTVQ